MPLPESFAASALAAGIATNLATDILTHQAPFLENTIFGKALKWAGFIAPNFQERLQDALKKSIELYFKKYPKRQALGVDEFFQRSVVVEQIGGAILNRAPLDETALQDAWRAHLSTQPVFSFLSQQQNLTAVEIISDFLDCYQRVLREQQSVPELAIAYDLLEQRTEFVQEIEASEERLKAYFTDVVKRKLSPQAQIEVYDAGQHELAVDLSQEMDAAGLVNAEQTVQVIRARLQPLPELFGRGLCKGRLLQPDPDHYFVSHGLTPDILPDWRQALTAVLLEGTQQTVEPYFSGDTLLGGFRLCGICEKLFTTRFSMFLLSPSEDRNVYLELGIAIGLGTPFFLIQHYEAQIPDILQGLSRYVKGGLFRTMRRELAGQIEEYDFGVVHFVSDLPQLGSQSTYLIAAGGLIEDEDFEGSIAEAVEPKYSHLKMVSLSNALNSPESTGWALEQLIEYIQASRFAVYRVDEECSPTTFLALGISIGLNRPFLMMHRSNREVPLDLRGMGMYQFPNFVTLQRDIVSQHQTFFDRYA
jgi:hypothetical protein